MSENKDKYIEDIIKANLQDMIESPKDIDAEKSWASFEEKLNKEKQKEARKKRVLKTKIIITVAATITLAIIAFPMLAPQQATAFRDEIYQLLTQSDHDSSTVIQTHSNPSTEHKPGFYENLSFNEAQELTVFSIKTPSELFALKDTEPTISVLIKNPPIAVFTMEYIKKDYFLSITQENIVGEKQKNTYIPQNGEITEEAIEDKAVTKISYGDKRYHILWHENSIMYSITSENISYEELKKILMSF